MWARFKEVWKDIWWVAVSLMVAQLLYPLVIKWLDS